MESEVLLDVRAAHIAKLLPFRALSDVRYYLAGVCVEPRGKAGVTMSASDGVTLATAACPGFADRARIIKIDRTTASLLTKKAPSGHTDLRLRLRQIGSATQLEIWATATAKDAKGTLIHIQASQAVLHATFPDFRKLAGGAWKPGPVGLFDARLLHRALALVASVSGGVRYGPFVQIFHKAEGLASPIMLRATLPDVDLAVMVMPARGDEIVPVPAWLTSPPKAAAAS